jgi:hypothetical protein
MKDVEPQTEAQMAIAGQHREDLQPRKEND